MTPTLCGVTGCIISIGLTYSCADALTYLFTVGSGSIKSAASPKRLKIPGIAKVTINGLYKVVHGLSIAAQMCDLE